MISLPLQPKIIEKKENKAIFEIEALSPGYGVTIGNSLRRVLLSSLSGAAVTQMKIKGVPHEFSTIPGVLEDVILIILNLKQLRFRLYSDQPQKATLKVKGEKKVKGSDFTFPPQVELVNKNSPIATLTTKSAELEMEIQIEKGIGYSPREARKEKLEIGIIPLDAIFTPIKRVSHRIENMRVGERTDFDRLFLEIETDGTIAPETALFQASEILVRHFSLFTDTFKKAERVLPVKAVIKKEKAKKKVKVSRRRKQAPQKKHEKKKKRKKT
jgi:DNA-directed RNA polymerase subunit alpha